MLKRSDPKKSGTRKQPDDPTLMHLAQRENFAIYLLKGRDTRVLNGIVPYNMHKELEYMQRRIIAYIKATQQQRMGKRKVKP
jgi:hypothetical protein